MVLQIWHGCPVLLVGTSDAERRFFPFGLAVVSKERHFDFKFIFNALQEGREKIDQPTLDNGLPLMADSAEAITNGWREAGFMGIRGMCWFHVTQNVKSRLLRISNKRHAAELKFYISKLQTSRSPSIFKVAAD